MDRVGPAGGVGAGVRHQERASLVLVGGYWASCVAGIEVARYRQILLQVVAFLPRTQANMLAAAAVVVAAAVDDDVDDAAAAVDDIGS